MQCGPKGLKFWPVGKKCFFISFFYRSGVESEILLMLLRVVLSLPAEMLLGNNDFKSFFECHNL